MSHFFEWSMAIKVYEIKGKSWVIETDDSGKICDIGIQLTQSEYNKVRKMLADPNINFQNSSSIDILKNAFAKARGETAIETAEHQRHGESNENIPSVITSVFLDRLESKTTTHLEKLSRYINSETDADTIKNMVEEYTAQLENLEQDFDEILAHTDLNESQKAVIKKDIETLKNNLIQKNTEFLSKNKKNAFFLLSAQDQSQTQSLGSFIGAQTQLISNAAVNITSVLQSRYLLDLYYQKNEITSAFIDARSALRLRHSSVYGARYVNTQTAYENSDEELPEEGFFSILPFMKGNSASDLDKIICLISETPLSQRSLSTLPKTWTQLFIYAGKRASIFVALYTLAPLTEITLTAVQIPLVAIFLTLPRVILSPFIQDPKGNFFDIAISKINQFRERISPLMAVKRLWNNQYKRLDQHGKPEQNEHQSMLDAFNQIKNESLIVNLAKAVTRSENVLNFARLGFHLGYQALGTIGLSAVSAITYPTRMFKKSPSDAVVFERYQQEYDRLKPIIEELIQRSKTDPKEKSLRFPGVKRQIDYSAESPARVINEVMYLLNEDVIHHLAEHHPGPATFFFLMSVATFGSNFAPIGALAWMHGAPGYFKLIQSGIAKAFTGYSGPMTGGSGAFHGSLAALLQFKLFTIGSSALLNATDKHNDILEKMANNPEEMIAGFVAFVGLGYAMGYIPQIPSVPNNFSILGQRFSANVGNVNVLSGYNLFLNSLIGEASDLKEGLFPLTSLEYGFLGYKAILLTHSMTLNGKEKSSLDENEKKTLINVLKKSNVLSIEDPKKRNEEISKLLEKTGLPTLSDKTVVENVQTFVTDFMEKDVPTIKARTQKIENALKTERTQWDKILLTPKVEKLNSFQKLQKAIKMLSDQDAPCTFANKKDAIQYYNELSRTFDQYNEEVSNGTYPNYSQIEKDDFLQAFRNKHISQGSNNLARLLSFYPGYPFRYFWREIQLALNPTPYVEDKIAASRAKDQVLAKDWIAILKMTGYNFMNLINKAIKASIGFLPTALIVSSAIATNIGLRLSGKPLDFRTMQANLQKLGRILDQIAIQNLFPSEKFRQRFAKEVHQSSRYDDIIAEGHKVCKKLENNEKIQKVNFVVGIDEEDKTSRETMAPRPTEEKQVEISQTEEAKPRLSNHH